MKQTDKFLIGVVAGVIILVGVAFGVALLRPKPTYKPEDTPEGVVHNYLLALQQEDYERAFHYLSPTIKGYPNSTENFIDDIKDTTLRLRGGSDSSTLEVESARINGDRAVVTLRETIFYNEIFFRGNEYSNTFEMKLKKEGGAWKLSAAESYWAWCWDEFTGCP